MDLMLPLRELNLKKEAKFRLDIRKNILTVSMVKHWDKLSKECEKFPSGESFGKDKLFSSVFSIPGFSAAW